MCGCALVLGIANCPSRVVLALIAGDILINRCWLGGWDLLVLPPSLPFYIGIDIYGIFFCSAECYTFYPVPARRLNRSSRHSHLWQAPRLLRGPTCNAIWKFLVASRPCKSCRANLSESCAGMNQSGGSAPKSPNRRALQLAADPRVRERPQAPWRENKSARTSPRISGPTQPNVLFCHASLLSPAIPWITEIIHGNLLKKREIIHGKLLRPSRAPHQIFLNNTSSRFVAVATLYTSSIGNLQSCKSSKFAGRLWNLLVPWLEFKNEPLDNSKIKLNHSGYR
jgi:hypothetical protein